MPFQQFGILKLIVFDFHKGVNLISLSLAEVFVSHGQLRLTDKKLDYKHPQPPNQQLIKFTLLTKVRNNSKYPQPPSCG